MPQYTAGTGIQINNDTLSAKIASSNEIGAVKPDGQTIGVSESGTITIKRKQTIVLSDSSLEITSGDSTTVTVVSHIGDGVLSVSTSDSNVATASISGITVTINAVGGGSCSITVTASETENYKSASSNIAVTSSVPIYGAEWDGSSSSAWTRTDAAANFSDPNPYYSGMSGSPSSPFDNIMPWSGMVVEERTGGTMVKIPKFWYKITQNGLTLKIQIADGEQDGFSVSPAHMDRDDGKGERDYVYVGRYHCTNDLKSTTGGQTTAHITRSAARSAIHNLGSNIWQMDFATRFTIWLLYLVEFANWNSQAKIGYGCGNNSYTENMGYTDSMPYHTGTTKSNRTNYGLGTQYRHIEGLWDNVYDWLDGCYYNGNGLNIIMNPSNFSDSTGGTAVGMPSSGYYPSKFAATDVSGAFPMFIPSEDGGSSSTYLCDGWPFSSSTPCLYAGGCYAQTQELGLFYLNSLSSSDDSYSIIGCRLMELP